MKQEYKDLIKKAQSVAIKKKYSNEFISGEVGCALVTDKDKVYVGTCFDMPSGIGVCGEHSAVSSMITKGENRIKAIVAVHHDGKILSPCGRCRELLFNLNNKNVDTDIIVDKDKVVKLDKLLPIRWQENW